MRAIEESINLPLFKMILNNKITMLAQNTRLFGKALFMSALVATTLTSCDKDDNDDDSYTVPTAYNFDNASYSGQTSRLNMLEEMTAYMKTANTAGVSVDASQLKAMYANDGFTWTSTALTSDQPTKQLKSKTATGQDVFFENWMDKMELASQSTTEGSSGTAGVVSSNDGAKKYLFDENGDRVIAHGEDPDRGLASGILGSFTDAPGDYTYDDVTGTETFEKGSKFKEELNEIVWNFGAEYWYDNLLAFRAGYFHEHKLKGARQFMSVGFGLKYQMLGIDAAYLIPFTPQHPLAETVRVGLSFSMSEVGNKEEESIIE